MTIIIAFILLMRRLRQKLNNLPKIIKLVSRFKIQIQPV